MTRSDNCRLKLIEGERERLAGCDAFEQILLSHLLHLPLSENIIQRYGNVPGVLHMIELEKGRMGLGLSLAGNRDRSRMSVFVVGIDPNGAAGRDGQMMVGDELLEVGRRPGYVITVSLQCYRFLSPLRSTGRSFMVTVTRTHPP